MMPINQLRSLIEAGYEIVHSAGEYVRASRNNQDYLLVWTGDSWRIGG